MHQYVVNIISEIFVLIELVFLLHRDLIKMKFPRNIYAAMIYAADLFTINILFMYQFIINCFFLPWSYIIDIIYKRFGL